MIKNPFPQWPVPSNLWPPPGTRARHWRQPASLFSYTMGSHPQNKHQTCQTASPPPNSTQWVPCHSSGTGPILYQYSPCPSLTDPSPSSQSIAAVGRWSTHILPPPEGLTPTPSQQVGHPEQSSWCLVNLAQVSRIGCSPSYHTQSCPA